MKKRFLFLLSTGPTWVSMATGISWVLLFVGLTLGLLATSFPLQAQTTFDFLGSGHDGGVTVTTSQGNGQSTVDGFAGNDPAALKDAARFLAQASIGYDYEMVEAVAASGAEAWIEEQFKLPYSDVVDLTQQIDQIVGKDPEEIWGIFQFRVAWWNVVLRDPDVLRQRVTYALSQIFVVSGFGSDLFEDVGMLSSNYYATLQEHAFGNYRDLLSAISRNLSMGLYLSHFQNPKSDPANNIHPDENYAREVMQLFSIGLYELNNDGSRKLDSTGNFIPTYDNDDIREFAKIFTGFGSGAPDGIFDPTIAPDDFPLEDAILPMKMYDEWHEPGEKRLLNGQIVPAGQSGMQDFEAAMDNLFHHPNVGPFIGKALIQFLVTANPSPDYVNRVALAFNNNGEGVRGDLKAVVKAILLDPEARDCFPTGNALGGKLREPLLRRTGFLRAFNAKPMGNRYLLFANNMIGWYNSTGQVPVYASSVFNFYQPEYQPNGPIADLDLVGPVFQIHNSSTSIGFINEVDRWTFRNSPLNNNAFYQDPNAVAGEEEEEEPEEGEEEEFEDEEPPTEIDSHVFLDFQDELRLTADPPALVDRLDILLACGQLSERSKNIIANAVATTPGAHHKLDMAIYLVLMSPEYAVLK